MTSAHLGKINHPTTKQRNLRPLVAWAIVCLCLFLPLWKSPTVRNFVASQERSITDSFIRSDERLPPRDDFVFLGIDAPSMTLDSLPVQTIKQSPTLSKMSQQFPWDRRVYADAIDRLAAAGAKLIIIDIVFAQGATPEEDTVLAETIARHRDIIVLAAAFAPNAEGAGKDSMQCIEPVERFLGPLDNETAFGYANFWPHPDDGIVRWATSSRTLNQANHSLAHPDEPVFSSLAAAAATKLGTPPPPHDIRLRFARIPNQPASDVYEPLSIYSIFVPQDWENKYAQGQFFQGKIVIIGPAAPTFHDTHTTPVGEIHGAQLHLHALGSYLENTQYKTSPFHSLHGWFISFLLGAVIALVVITRYQRVTSLALIILSICALFVACHYLLISTANTLAGGLHILITSAVVILTVLITQAIAEHARRQELQRHLRRSMSPDVADAIVRAPDGYYAAAQGNRKNVTVLFSDVRGFTERSEEQDPDTLIAQLNQYLAAMVEVVFAHGGTVDKFIGDAIMATWGSLSETDGRRAACNAALAMQRELSKLNAQWSTENLPPFHVGIGIHHGAALVGEIGSNQRTDFTVIGDSVNLASRIESLTKTLQTIILISEETQQGLDSARKNDWIKLGSFQVKGKRQAVCLYGAKPEATATSNTFSSALELFTQGDFTSASSLFSKSKSFGPSQFYLQWLENHPHPPNRWDGTIQMEQK